MQVVPGEPQKNTAAAIPPPLAAVPVEKPNKAGCKASQVLPTETSIADETVTRPPVSCASPPPEEPAALDAHAQPGHQDQQPATRTSHLLEEPQKSDSQVTGMSCMSPGPESATSFGSGFSRSSGHSKAKKDRSSDENASPNRNSTISARSHHTTGTTCTQSSFFPLKSDQQIAPEKTRLLHILLIFLSITLPNAVLMVVFSVQGMGTDIFNAVAHDDVNTYGNMLLSGSVFFGGLLLIFDWWYFPKAARGLTFLIIVSMFCIGTVFKGRRYPWAAMLLTLSFMPGGLGCIRFRYPRVERRGFYGAIAVFTLLTAVGIVVIWITFMVSDDYTWGEETRKKLAIETAEVYRHVHRDRVIVYGVDCGKHKNETMLKALKKKEREAITDACTQANTVWYLSYMCPCIAVGCDLVVCVFCLVTGVVAKVDTVSSIQTLLSRFVLMIAFVITGMYASTTMSATSLHLGSTLLAFFFAGLAILCAWVYLEVDVNHLKAHASQSKLMQQLIAVAKSDWTKAMGFSVVGGPLLLFFAMSILTNYARKCRGAAGDYKRDQFTRAGRKIWDHISKWEWTSIFVKIILLQELLFAMQVGVAKITYIFLSWLNGALKPVEFSVVCVLVFVIGGTMFLLPPVPGLPVYVFAGIVLGEKGRQNDSIGFWLGCTIAAAVGLFTKLCACVGQYMIGYFLGRSLKVQQLIGVDKVPTRAIEQVLKSRGLNPGKVAILVGGPDWPTSVTCGIVRVNIPQMLLGTLPVVTLLAPCILAGGCMGRVSPGESSEWSMMASGFTAVAAVVNMASMAYAVYTVSQVIQKCGDSLAEPRPEHEAVQELTRQEQAGVEAYNEVIAWCNLSIFWRTILLSSTFGMLLSNFSFIGLSSMCFEPFAVSSEFEGDEEDGGLDGNPFAIIVEPMGWIALGGFCVALMLHVLFVRFMGRTAKRGLRLSGGEWRSGSLIGF